MWWIILVLIYGILKGVRDIAKKKALEYSGVVEVLFVYTLLAFLFTVPTTGNVFGVPLKEMLMIAFKSFIIFIAFLCSFYAIEKMPVSLYGVIDLSRMLFAMLLGVFVLKETLRPNQYVALVLVSGGLMLLRYKPNRNKNKKRLASANSGKEVENIDLSMNYEATDNMVSTVAESESKVSNVANSDSVASNVANSNNVTSDHIATYIYIFAFISTFLNAVSGMMDKILMGGGNITSGQLQFWYMFYMVIYYALYVVVTKTKIQWKAVLKNKYVWTISILFVIADRCLFIANGMAGSRVTVMTLLKQVCCIVTIVGGKVIFKEKDTLHRFICAAIVIAGIVFSVL